MKLYSQECFSKCFIPSLEHFIDYDQSKRIKKLKKGKSKGKGKRQGSWVRGGKIRGKDSGIQFYKQAIKRTNHTIPSSNCLHERQIFVTVFLILYKTHLSFFKHSSSLSCISCLITSSFCFACSTSCRDFPLVSFTYSV